MKSNAPKMSLKPYLEAIQAHCQALSKEDLIQLLLDLAREVPVGERGEFLNRVRIPPLERAAESGELAASRESALLERITALREEIEERVASIEDGSYWDDLNEWKDGYDDEDPDHVTGEQLVELEALCLEVDGVYLDGQRESARRLYRALFDLLDLDEEIAYGLSRDTVDLREARARYCRCVYETSEDSSRVEEFFECMKGDTGVDPNRFDPDSEPLPTLRDVMDAAPGDLPGIDSFLPEWEKKLVSCPSGRSGLLELEAVRCLRGVKGVALQAREWKSTYPSGYLFWMRCLEEEGDWRGMLDAGREALEVIPRGGFRKQAADGVVKAASELGDAKAVLYGRRERFLSAPDEASLIVLMEEAEKQGVRSEELGTLLSLRSRIDGGEGARGALYRKMLLMAGRLGEVFEQGRNEPTLGWSYGGAGGLFASVLLVLTRNAPEAAMVHSLLKEYSTTICGFGCGDSDAVSASLYEQIVKGLEPIVLSEEERQEYAAWANKTGRDRVESIVSGKHRRAYDRAALALGALAECHVLSGEKEKAVSLLHEFLKVKFPRHHAFRSEVKSVMGQAPLLRDFRVV